MNLADLINKNISKKMGIALAGIYALVHVQAPSWQIAIVASVAIIAQCILDYKEKKL